MMMMTFCAILTLGFVQDAHTIVSESLKRLTEDHIWVYNIYHVGGYQVMQVELIEDDRRP